MCVCVCVYTFYLGGGGGGGYNTDRQTGRKVLSNSVYLALSTVHMRTWNTPQRGNKKIVIQVRVKSQDMQTCVEIQKITFWSQCQNSHTFLKASVRI